MDGRVFARIIERELAERGIKKGDFYTGAGVTATALYGWKRGATPSAETVAAVEDYLGISFADVGREDSLDTLREDLRILLNSAKGLPPSSVYEIISKVEKMKENVISD